MTHVLGVHASLHVRAELLLHIEGVRIGGGLLRRLLPGRRNLLQLSLQPAAIHTGLSCQVWAEGGRAPTSGRFAGSRLAGLTPAAPHAGYHAWQTR